MNMEPLTVLLLIVVLCGALAVVGHLIAKHTWPLRRELWRHRAELVEEEARMIGDEADLEKPEAGMGDEQPRPLAAHGSAHDARATELAPPAGEQRQRGRYRASDRTTDTSRPPASAEPETGRRVPGEPVAGEDPLTRLRRRRAAGLSKEDLDY
jgi:hypothetical protein